LLEYLSEITGSKIYLDLLKENTSREEILNPCRLKITELKDFRTKEELFYGKYGKLLSKYFIPKNTFNRHSFQWNYKIICFIKYMGGDFIPELLQLEEGLDTEIPQQSGKDMAVSMFTEILREKYPSQNGVCNDIGRMLYQLLYNSLKEFRKHLPSRSILEGRKKLIEYHDSLVFLFEEVYDDDLDEMEIKHIKKQEQIQQDRKIYKAFAEKLPVPWKEFTAPQELVHESHIMENCIRTYSQDLHDAECGLYWAEINGKRYNAEVVFNKNENRMNLIQLFGKKNSTPIKKDVLSFVNYVKNFVYSS
ncbi:MAG: PcfJ domain-containing protein, partial [Treponema sp.]|nr:PcfJ domain-containing protein [Treponema sp.]